VSESNGQERGRRKIMTGVVVSTKMDKTAVVSVQRSYPHPLYHKIMRVSKKYKAHDPNNAAVLGDLVRIVETRPLSKEKRWRIVETLVRGNVAEIAPREIGVPEEAMPERQAPPPRGTPEEAALDETDMHTESEVLESAHDDLDARDYDAQRQQPSDLSSGGATSGAPETEGDAVQQPRSGAARSAAEAADEGEMSTESDVLRAASDDMDESDYEEGPRA
jgi:small subunit ribosomal protein S17